MSKLFISSSYLLAVLITEKKKRYHNTIDTFIGELRKKNKWLRFNLGLGCNRYEQMDLTLYIYIYIPVCVHTLSINILTYQIM